MARDRGPGTSRTSNPSKSTRIGVLGAAVVALIALTINWLPRSISERSLMAAPPSGSPSELRGTARTRAHFSGFALNGVKPGINVTELIRSLPNTYHFRPVGDALEVSDSESGGVMELLTTDGRVATVESFEKCTLTYDDKKIVSTDSSEQELAKAPRLPFPLEQEVPGAKYLYRSPETIVTIGIGNHRVMDITITVTKWKHL